MRAGMRLPDCGAVIAVLYRRHRKKRCVRGSASYAKHANGIEEDGGKAGGKE